ncbi:IS1634 family transposase [Robinsoniella peoriensis]|uniref:IS1634 family transposase n=1 Tax=Robinsoniella peoriensis TaxID=180332 RepID=UPI0036289486
MYLRKINRPNGVYLAIQESYYDSVTKKSRTRTIQSLGYLDALKKQYDDPIAFFTQHAKEMTEQKKVEKSVSITIDRDEKMATETDDIKNVGYAILKELYKQLEIDKFWNWKTRNLSIEFSVDQIFRLLVFSRILCPASKKETYDHQDFFFEDFGDFSLDDVYHSLDIICENNEALQKWIFDHSDKICDRNLSVSYFDCTNYYFDIGRSDMDTLDDSGKPIDKDGNPVAAKYRKRGPEKNHRPDPIVEMGLLMDRNCIPLAFDLFPGNESEKVHMRPIINRVKKDFSDTRIIFVADRGLNTSDNIYYLNGDNKGDVNERDGYVYGQSIRGADAAFKKWVLEGGYHTDKIKDEEGNEITFTHKSRIFPKELHVNVTKPGRKKPLKKTVLIDQKQMVYYSEKYAKKQRTDREVMIQRAKDLIKSPKKYDKITSAGSAAYILNISFNKNTGEIVEGKNLELNLEKIEEEKKYDGYYSIVTSELNMSDLEMREVYRGLINIEDTFKISKTEFDSRPLFVWKNEHIDAHFTTCFTALVLIRLLQTKLENKYPVGKIIDALKKYCCVPIDTNTYQLTYYDKVLESCAKVFDMELDNKYRTRQQIQRLLRY